MTRWYLDTSAALKLLVEEPESVALAAAVDDAAASLSACWLLDTEIRRAAQRIPGLTQSAVTDVLRRVDLYEVPPSLFREAGLLPGPHLRSLDALHLAAATRLGVDALLTYDHRMTTAAHEVGMTVLAPA